MSTIRAGDRIAWIGSSSTHIGVWPKTVEFLLRTRHPELALQFHRSSTGGGTFATGLENLDKWLDEFHPTLVVFNYGGNDAAAGRNGVPRFLENMERCVAKAQASGARVILVTPQAADVRKSGARPASLRAMYADVMLDVARRKNWRVIDVHHAIDVLQTQGQSVDRTYSILKDKIHLTDPAYVAWGYFFFDRLDLPVARSDASLSAKGVVLSEVGCKITDVEVIEGGLAFYRADLVLPILPPGPLPPRGVVPLEARSRYLLTIEALPTGIYDIACEGKPIGSASAESLANGVNLNSLLLDSGHEAPWADLARDLWNGAKIDQVGKSRWRFEIRKR